MWYKITNLKSEKLTNPQIANQLGVHRTTVSRYLSMTEAEFRASQRYQRSYPTLLDAYEEQIHQQLQSCNDLSASQIHDRLKEVYADFPNINEKTVYNFVQKVRKKYGIAKTSSTRHYQKCEETAYGEYAQVDFGERYMPDTKGGYIKVYFFAMVLCRSRSKFIFFSKTPFNAELSVYAHELAFEYYGGVPRKIIYDQDKVFIVKENFGDYLLTSIFDAYVSHSSFKPIFCRKEDPESKGKCENVVKYVKNNFLKGREFTDIATLNKEALGWLARTGNGKMHAGIRKIPSEVLLVEKALLTPYQGAPKQPTVEMREYVVRKDNTISYKGCFYSVPVKTYINDKSVCYVEEKEGLLLIYNQQTGKQIGMHKVPEGKGEFILQPGHHTENQYKYPDLESRLYKYVGKEDFIQTYLGMMRKDRPRYYCDALRHILANMDYIDAAVLKETIIEMATEQIFNPHILIECALSKSLRQNMNTDCTDIELQSDQGGVTHYEMEVDRSDIKTYDRIMS
ncbi:MAG: IS21 family transposase [Tannerellaceae bacterium]